MSEINPDENASGKVFIYNTTNQRIQLQLNEESLASIDAAGAGMPYTPKFTTADRDDVTSTPDNRFAQKDNFLRVKFPGKQRTYGPIDIDPESYPTDINLVLYSTGAESACLSPRAWMLLGNTSRPVNSGVGPHLFE
jgi:hypothetical protein